MDDPNPKRIAEMVGETFREAAVLFLVFLPLDLFFSVSSGDLSLANWQIILVVGSAVFGSAILEFFGIVLERWR